MTAGLLLSARSVAERLGLALEMPSVAQILEATGASRSRAYELMDEILVWLPGLARPPGRPRVEPDPEPPTRHAELLTEVIRFVMQHPGCVQRGERASYSELYRRFVIELRERHADVTRSAFAEAIQIPLGTLDDWMRDSAFDDHAANRATGACEKAAVRDNTQSPEQCKDSDTVNLPDKSTISDTANPCHQGKAGDGDTAGPPGERTLDDERTLDSAASSRESCALTNIANPHNRDTVNDIVNSSDTCVVDDIASQVSALIGNDTANAINKYGTNDIANSLDQRTPQASASRFSERAVDTATNPPRVAAHDAKLAQIETVLAAWHTWHGTVHAFCEHVRRDHRLNLGNTLITNILFEHGVRTPRRRGGRSRDEEALRNSFETFFPGAQWVGDGKQLAVVLNGKTFAMNLELIVDAKTGAAVGISVRDEEDSAAVVEAFTHGVQTTGDAPLACLLDNRPSNHTPDVDAALGDTLRIRATPGRAQNKAHVEGAFGLFAQKVPPIDLDTRDSHTLAKAIAKLVATTFFRALNRAPRRDRDGKTRVELYAQDVTPEQREAARAALRERMRKQELAQRTRAARTDPVIRAMLDDAFARLGLLDPERHIRDAIACYPRDAIVDAIATFTGKRDAGTLPAGVDARYLLGIVKNIHHTHQAEPITEALIRERLSARDRFLEPIVRERDAILAAADADVGATLITLVDRLVCAERTIDRHIWLDAAATLVASRAHDERIALAKRAARRIHTVFRIPTHDRDHLERALLRRLWPLE